MPWRVAVLLHEVLGVGRAQGAGGQVSTPAPMSPLLLRTFVPGTPAPQGSKRHVGGGRLIESSKKVAPWRETVAASLTGRVEPAKNAVIIEMSFFLKRPMSHYRTGKHAGELKDWAPTVIVTKPDLDKLVRSTCDAITMSGIIRDDSQIVEILAGKHYADPGEPTGVELRICERTE